MPRHALLTALILLSTSAVPAAEGPAGPVEKRPVKIWNRSGPLGEAPERTTNAWPLSDQANRGGWMKFEPLSDECLTGTNRCS